MSIIGINRRLNQVEAELGTCRQRAVVVLPDQTIEAAYQRAEVQPSDDPILVYVRFVSPKAAITNVAISS